MIVLKTDVDTFRGLREGLLPLLELFEAECVRASIFFSLGPDESGKAVKRIFRNKGFIKKMFRTNAPKLYGFKTMLYGTLLPAPVLEQYAAPLIRRAETEGHDAGVHAWSHVRWQDELDFMSADEIAGELGRAAAAFAKATCHKPEGFAAPAWKINEAALQCLAGGGWKYTSFARGNAPVLPAIGQTASDIPEIPTTLPTLDEILGWDGMTADKALEFLLNAPQHGKLNVFTLHTEAEGLAYRGFFTRLLKGWKAARFRFITMSEAAAALGGLKSGQIRQGELPGRSGLVALA